MGLDYPGLLADLRHESDRLIEHLNGLAHEQWGLATPASGWSIHDQVSHLAFFDDTARLALTKPDEFRALADKLTAEGADFPDRPRGGICWPTSPMTIPVGACRGSDPT